MSETKLGGEIGFRPLQRNDFPMLVSWLRAPHVARWWREPATLEFVENEYGPTADGEESTEVFVLEMAGAPVGLIQRYRHADEPDWDRAVGVEGACGIDYLIGAEDMTGRGLGSRMIHAFACQSLAAWSDVACVCAVTQQENVASWRALEKAGFTRVKEFEQIASEHPSDSGPSFVYVLERSGEL